MSDKFGLDTLEALVLKIKMIFRGLFCVFLPTFSPKQVYIDHVYSDTQRLLLITFVCTMPILFILILFLEERWC